MISQFFWQRISLMGLSLPEQISGFGDDCGSEIPVSEILVNSYPGIPGQELGPEGQSLRRTYGAH